MGPFFDTNDTNAPKIQVRFHLVQDLSFPFRVTL